MTGPRVDLRSRRVGAHGQEMIVLLGDVGRASALAAVLRNKEIILKS